LIFFVQRDIEEIYDVVDNLRPEIERLLVAFNRQKTIWENYQTNNKMAYGTAFGVSSVGVLWYAGGWMSITPAAPVGWMIGFAASGFAIYGATDYFDADQYRQFKNMIELELIDYNT